jgi:hypothetical protein
MTWELVRRIYLLMLFLPLALLDSTLWGFGWLTLFVLNYVLFWRVLHRELARVF